MTDRQNRDDAEGAGLPPIDETLHTSDIIDSLQHRALSPPAMREQILSVWKVVGYDRAEKFCWAARPEQVLAALAVPVPPADGARTSQLQETVRQCRRAWLEAVYPNGQTNNGQAVTGLADVLDAFLAPVDADAQEAMNDIRSSLDWRGPTGEGHKKIVLSRKRAEALVRSSSPSPAIAAEPVAWRWKYEGEDKWSLSGHKRSFFGDKDVIFEPLYAAPPVRGDRETIARIIDSYMNKFEIRRVYQDYLLLADAILSLFKGQIK